MTGSTAGGSPGTLAEDLLRVVLHVGQGALPRYGVRERAGSARRLDVVLRAALLCDLARAGLVTGIRGPVATGGHGRPGSAHSRGEAGGAVTPGPIVSGPAGDGTAGTSAGPAGTRPGGAGASPGGTEASPGGTGAGPGGTGARPAGAGAGPGGAEDRILGAVLAAVSQRPDVAWARWFRHVRDDRSALVARMVGSGRWIAAGGHRFRDADPRGAERLQARTFTVSELVEAPSDERETVLGYLYALTGPGMSAELVLGWDVRLARLDATPSGPTVRAVLAAARSVNRRGRFSRR